MKKYEFLSTFKDRHGKPRYRFRRKGYRTRYINEPFGSKAFEKAYAALLAAEEPLPLIGANKIKHGSVSDVVMRYYADGAFQDMRESTQTVYRGVIERFRATFGDDPMRQFDAARIAKLMNAMRDRPHAAARLRKILKQLLSIARREKLVPDSFDPIKDTRPPRAESEGYHRWTEDELSAFEARHPLGTKPRLAFALLLYGAQRSGDVRNMTHDMIAAGRIELTQSKTRNSVSVPIVEPLQEALVAGPLGKVRLLESKTGEAFTPKGFYGMMKRACIAADLGHCSPHGLRKSAARRLREAGCSDDEGMAITGHKTVKEYRRYAGDSGNADRANSGMARMMANRPSRLAKAPQKTEESRDV